MLFKPFSKKAALVFRPDILCLFALMTLHNLHHLLINTLLIFGLTSFGCLHTRALPTTQTTHGVE
jgi:hypothetical protein